MFGHTGDIQWLEEVFPLHDGNELKGALVILVDSGYIRDQSYDSWWRSFLRIVADGGVDRRRHVRHGALVPDDASDAGRRTVAASAHGALREGTWRRIDRSESIQSTGSRSGDDGGESASRHVPLRQPRLDCAMRESTSGHRSGLRYTCGTRPAGRIFVVSNREPYMHVRQGRETVCIVPPSGLVTAIEPVLRACDGVWVASGNGNADAENVDEFDRLRVPPDDPHYTLRRVWLSAEEESNYYDGFANEGLWPLCHIAHTRPMFRAADWECYQRVNEKFATCTSG